MQATQKAGTSRGFNARGRPRFCETLHGRRAIVGSIMGTQRIQKLPGPDHPIMAAVAVIKDYLAFYSDRVEVHVTNGR
jgi:hypothetical protein